MGEVSKATQPPRLRTAGSIDLTKAKPGCKRCNGTGKVGYKTIDNPEDPKGDQLRVPIICRCVTRRGGVKKDMMDRMLEELDQQLRTGSFSKNLARDIRRLPAEHQPRAIEALRKQAQDTTKDPTVRSAIEDTLRALEEDN